MTAGPQVPAPAVSPDQAMRRAIEACGYFPDLVIDAVLASAGSEPVVDYLVHHQPTFTHDQVHRHLTVLVRTPSRLIIAHTDDYPADEAPAGELTEGGASLDWDGPRRLLASTSTEVVSLHRIVNVALTRVVGDPQSYRSGDPRSVEAWLSVDWGGVSRLDLEPASCDDPNCEADHGYSGSLGGDDLTIRMSAAGEGPADVARLTAFGTALQQVAGQSAAVPVAGQQVAGRAADR